MKRRKLYIQPNKASIRDAKLGLEARKKAPKSKKGGLDAMQAAQEGIGSGVLRARDIIAGKKVNAYQVKAFFDRHRRNYINAKMKGLEPEESPAIQAWLIWGGEPLRKQAKKAVREDKKRRARKKNPGNFDIAHGHPMPTLQRNPVDPALRVKGLSSAKKLERENSSFDRPSEADLRRIGVGDWVQVCRNRERFWLRVTGYIGKQWHGQICNSLVRNSDIKKGDRIFFMKRNIYDIKEK